MKLFAEFFFRIITNLIGLWLGFHSSKINNNKKKSMYSFAGWESKGMQDFWHGEGAPNDSTCTNRNQLNPSSSAKKNSWLLKFNMKRLSPSYLHPDYFAPKQKDFAKMCQIFFFFLNGKKMCLQTHLLWPSSSSGW